MTPALPRWAHAFPLWTFLGFSLDLGAAEESLPPDQFARAPYVQLATPNSIHIVWRTAGPVEPVVRYGPRLDKLEQKISAGILTRVSWGTNPVATLPARVVALRTPENLRLPRLHSAAAGTFQYEARLGALRPDTTYYYAIYDGEKRLTEKDNTYRFRTHPLPGQPKPMRFWVVGDSGTGRETQASIHSSMMNYTSENKRPIDFYLHVGDMAYNRGRDVEFQTRFFEMYEPTIRHTVCWAAMGNHEGATSKGTNGTGPYYDAYVLPTRGEAGGVPSGLEAFYAFDYGRAHFVCLDSHDLDRKPTGAMARWLKMDLEKTKADWVIAYFHHPPYTKGSHDSDKEKQLIEIRTHIMPILESGGVDIVLTGHSHIYERSMLMDGAYATPTVAENVILDDGDGDPSGDGAYKKSAGIHPNQGEVQIVAGHGGTKLGRKGTMPVMKKIIVEHGSVLIDIAGDTLEARMLNKYGEVRDYFSMVKRGKISPVRLANPWQPPIWSKPKLPGGREPAAEPPEDFIAVVPKNAEWQYLAGSHPHGNDWQLPNFADTTWKMGKAGFGYGGKDDATELEGMKNHYSTVYIRHEFELEQADYISDIGLMIRYDDAFIAYLNGKEVIRKGVDKGSGAKAESIKSHNGDQVSYYPIKDFEKVLRNGTNVLAIEGHNDTSDSSDFTLDPYLIVED